MPPKLHDKTIRLSPKTARWLEIISFFDSSKGSKRITQKEILERLVKEYFEIYKTTLPQGFKYDF